MQDIKVVDNSVVSYFVWAKILKADQAKKGIEGYCEPKTDFFYKCILNVDGKKYEFEISAEEMKRLARTFKFDQEGNRYRIDVKGSKLERMRKIIETVDRECSGKKCYVSPDLAIAFKDGQLKNIFQLSITGAKINYFPMERIYNKVLYNEFLNKYSRGILVDKDLRKWVGNKYENLLENASRIYKVEVDKENKLNPLLVIETSSGKILYDPVTKEVIFNGKKIQLKEEYGPAVRQLIKVLDETPVDVQKLNEAIKIIKNIEVREGGLKVKKFYPDMSIVDVYLRGISNDPDVKVITADKDLKDIYVRISGKNTLLLPSP